MVNYKILSFDELTAQIVVEFDGMPPMAIDLVIDEDGNVPVADELDTAIRMYYPSWVQERNSKLAKGVKNANAIKNLIAPAPPPSIDFLKNSIRSARNKILFDTDWTQLPDAPLTEEQKFIWAEYRQALRDITEQAEFPENVTFPDQPFSQ
jgi:hypothetical protein